MNLMTINHDQATIEIREVTALARDLARGELAPRALALDHGSRRALTACWEHVEQVGFDRALLDEDSGGVGLSPGTLVAALEQLAIGDAGFAMLVLLANAACLARPDEVATDRGRWATIYASPEPPPVASRIEFAENGEATTVSGEIPVALGALEADRLAVLTGGPQPSIFALDPVAGGLDREAVEAQLGLRAAAAARIDLTAVATDPRPAANEQEIMALLRSGIVAIARGLSRRALELATEYALSRHQGGVPIAEHDAVRSLLTGMAIRLGAPPPLKPAADPDAAELNLIALQTVATDAAVAITTDAVQVFGGSGYVHETGVEKLMRDAKWLQAWPEPAWFRRSSFAGTLLSAATS